MAVNDIVLVVAEEFEQTRASASPDLLRTMVRRMAQFSLSSRLPRAGIPAGHARIARRSPQYESARPRGRPGTTSALGYEGRRRWAMPVRLGYIGVTVI